MDEALPAQIISIVLLLFLSAFFSGAETAFFSINYITLEKIKNKKDKKLQIIYKLLKYPNKLLITILVGNMTVNILAAALSSALSIQVLNLFNINDVIATSISIVVMTIILLYFGEISPKLISINQPLKVAEKIVYPVLFFIYFLRPVSILFQLVADFITNMFKVDINRVSNNDIESIIKLSHKEGIIDKEEKVMFENIFESLNKEVQDIMHPKTKMFLIDANKSVNTIIKKAINSKYHSIPLYEKSHDNIIGILYKQDIIPIHFKIKSIKSIKEILRPVYYVPEGKYITDLLRDLQQEKNNFAVIVDEFGNSIGFVTLDDLIEEIIGEYNEEYDTDDKFYKKLSDNRYKFKGDAKLEDFNELFGEEFETKDYTTINGFLLDKFQKIPDKNEEIKIGKYLFHIDRVRGPRIESVTVTKN